MRVSCVLLVFLRRRGGAPGGNPFRLSRHRPRPAAVAECRPRLAIMTHSRLFMGAAHCHRAADGGFRAVARAAPSGFKSTF